MKYLLDTHCLLWALSNPKQLTAAERLAISDENNLVFASYISLWELSIKESIGKIKLPNNFYAELSQAGFEWINIAIEHLTSLKKLPMHHRDPFDRMLVVQAKVEQLTMITRDQEIMKYAVDVL